jgi:TnpA family transposase
MPVDFLTEAERERLNRFPETIAPGDVNAYFLLTPADLKLIRKRSGAHNRLGCALQLCSLRFLGFILLDLSSIPAEVISYVARQLKVSARSLADYGSRERTRQEQLREIQTHLGFRRASEKDLATLGKWLLERALEHDKPTLLFQLACQKLIDEKIVRPGVTRLERMVATAREQAQSETFNHLSPLLTDERKKKLDHLLFFDKESKQSSLVWLRQSATSISADAILGTLNKLDFLRELGVDKWDLSKLNPNRLKFLAQIARKSTAQALERAPEMRRYPILIAFLAQTLVDVIDETIDLFDRCLAQSYAKAGRELEEFRKSVARATNEKVYLFQELASLILDPSITDSELRPRIYEAVKPEALRAAAEECAKIVRPLDDSYFDLLADKYGYFRRFVPRLLEAFEFHSNRANDPLLEAIGLLREMNLERKRKLPEDARLDFVAAKWKPYVVDGKGKINYRYYELCTLWELRGALRAGNLWIEGSRRYANPESYLIPPERWPNLRTEVCQMLRTPEDAEVRLAARQAELETLLKQMDEAMGKAVPAPGNLRIESGNLVVPRLKAEELPDSVTELEDLVLARLPRIELTDLLIEVDSWVNFTDAFEHAGGNQPRTKDLRTYLYASILAQACNLGPLTMAEVSDLSYRKLAWCTTWHLREETLREANNRIVNFQYHQPLAKKWGGGTLSSSDGQRFPVSVKSAQAVSLPRYFGYGQGLTFYTWTSDQHSQYGTKPTPSTVRDATYVLDEILDNETELEIQEHTTDTAGFTEIVFALFDLLGLQFSPRLRDLGDQQLYRMDRTIKYDHIQPLLKGKINRELIVRHWDDLLRVAGSLKLGWVTASLLIGKLQSSPRRNALAHALQEYGKLNKTIFILRYLQSEEHQRRVGRQINKGEALHALRRFIFFANEGQIRKRQREEQFNQANCLNLVTNAVVAWNTVYMAAVIEQLKAEGHTVNDEDVAHLSPARYSHINPYGKYRFNVEEVMRRKGLRPLRKREEIEEES